MGAGFVAWRTDRSRQTLYRSGCRTHVGQSLARSPSRGGLTGAGPGGNTGALQARVNMASARPELWGMTLANTDLGEKRTCPHCGAKFYDLGKRPVICPKCKTEFDPVSDTAKPKRTREKPKAAPVKDDDEDEEVEDDEDEDEDVDDDEDDEDDDVEDEEDDAEVADDEEDPVATEPKTKTKRAPARDFDAGDDDEEVEVEEDDDDLTIVDEDDEFEEDDLEVEDGEDEEDI